MKFTQYAYFIEVHTLIPVFILMLHSLDGDQLPRLLVEGFGHGPEAPVSQLVTKLVFLHLNVFIKQNATNFLIHIPSKNLNHSFIDSFFLGKC